MRESTEERLDCPGESAGEVLEAVLREGARKLLQKAIEEEVEEFLERYEQDKGADGQRLVVRNGYMPEREILSGLGPIRIKQPRVDDRKLGARRGEEGFSSRILPRYLRRIPSVDNLVPALYLKGISTGDFPRALEAILGEGAKGLSARVPRVSGRRFQGISDRPHLGHIIPEADEILQRQEPWRTMGVRRCFKTTPNFDLGGKGLRKTSGSVSSVL